MRPEDCFDFITEPIERIRLKGTRIDLTMVIELHRQGLTPEQIVERFPTLEVVQVDAAIAYFMQNRESVEEYMRRVEDFGAKIRREIESRQSPSEAVQRIRALKAAHAAAEAEQP